jgi:hypothetical protein
VRTEKKAASCFSCSGPSRRRGARGRRCTCTRRHLARRSRGASRYRQNFRPCAFVPVSFFFSRPCRTKRAAK